MANFLFYLMSVGAILCSLVVVSARNPVVSVLSLLGTFVCLATIYLLAGFLKRLPGRWGNAPHVEDPPLLGRAGGERPQPAAGGQSFGTGEQRPVVEQAVGEEDPGQSDAVDRPTKIRMGEKYLW